MPYHLATSQYFKANLLYKKQWEVKIIFCGFLAFLYAVVYKLFFRFIYYDELLETPDEAPNWRSNTNTQNRPMSIFTCDRFYRISSPRTPAWKLYFWSCSRSWDEKYSPIYYHLNWRTSPSPWRTRY